MLGSGEAEKEKKNCEGHMCHFIEYDISIKY